MAGEINRSLPCFVPPSSFGPARTSVVLSRAALLVLCLWPRLVRYFCANLESGDGLFFSRVIPFLLLCSLYYLSSARCAVPRSSHVPCSFFAHDRRHRTSISFLVVIQAKTANSAKRHRYLYYGVLPLPCLCHFASLPLGSLFSTAAVIPMQWPMPWSEPRCHPTGVRFPWLWLHRTGAMLASHAVVLSTGNRQCKFTSLRETHHRKKE